MTKKYLFKYGSKLKMFSENEIKDMSYLELMTLGFDSIHEQRKRLLLDAQGGQESYFYGHKVVDSLETSIMILEGKIPSLRKQAQKLACGEQGLN